MPAAVITAMPPWHDGYGSGGRDEVTAGKSNSGTHQDPKDVLAQWYVNVAEGPDKLLGRTDGF